MLDLPFLTSPRAATNSIIVIVDCLHQRIQHISFNSDTKSPKHRVKLLQVYYAVFVMVELLVQIGQKELNLLIL